MDDDRRRGRGDGVVMLAAASTAFVVATSAAGAMFPESGGLVHAWLSGLLFVAGVVALLWAFALGVGRSRTEAVHTAGLFLLVAPVAPPAIRRRLTLAVAVQSAAVVAAAAVRPYTAVAFGILAPTFTLGLMGLWGARFGTFPERPPKQGSRSARGHAGECPDG